jgi:hypothetical protein
MQQTEFTKEEMYLTHDNSFLSYLITLNEVHKLCVDI